ncbi:MAG: LptF/LptG family permease [Bacteroidetes bacterium]|nr:LptF/LptG family permease [Bacteroidota bacterium]
MKKIIDILLSPFNRWLSIIDRYVISKFVVTTIFAHVLIISIAIVIDFSDKSENFVERNAPSGEVFQYYLDFIPFIGSILAPLLIFLAVIFLTSRMAYNSEIIAMMNSGMNFKRFLRPYLICGFAALGLLLYGNYQLVPETNKRKLDFEDKYIHTPKNFGNNLHLKLDKNTFISLERFKFKTNEGFNVSLERYEGNGKSRKLITKINANKMTYETDKKSWHFVDYKRWDVYDIREKYVEGKTMDTVLNLVPDDFEQDIRIKDVLTYQELEEYIKEKENEGTGELEYYRVEQYRRASSAVSVLILVVMGAALGSKKIRGGNWFNIIAGVALSALYVFFLQFSTSFSINSDLHPIIGTNIPNMLFAVIAIFLVRYASK